MKNFLPLIAIILFLSGCAFFKQAQKDYQLHKATPYREGEVTVEEQTLAAMGTVSAIPYLNLATPFILLGGPYIFGWLRGRKLNKERLSGVQIKSPTVLDVLLKHLDEVRLGIFETGPDGSALKRGWKVGLLSLVAAWLAPEIGNHLIPFINDHHPIWLNSAALASLTGLLAALEKRLSQKFSSTVSSSPEAVSSNPI